MMEEDWIKIRVEVAQRFVDITIKREWESYYREAEKIINESFLTFAKRWTYTDHQDLLSKILVDFVVKWIENDERLKEYEEGLVPMMEELKTLSDGLSVD